jgi:hypothetical protein
LARTRQWGSCAAIITFTEQTWAYQSSWRAWGRISTHLTTPLHEGGASSVLLLLSMSTMFNGDWRPGLVCSWPSSNKAGATSRFTVAQSSCTSSPRDTLHWAQSWEHTCRQIPSLQAVPRSRRAYVPSRAAPVCGWSAADPCSQCEGTSPGQLDISHTLHTGVGSNQTSPKHVKQRFKIKYSKINAFHAMLSYGLFSEEIDTRGLLKASDALRCHHKTS